MKKRTAAIVSAFFLAAMCWADAAPVVAGPETETTIDVSAAGWTEDLSADDVAVQNSIGEEEESMLAQTEDPAVQTANADSEPAENTASQNAAVQTEPESGGESTPGKAESRGSENRDAEAADMQTEEVMDAEPEESLESASDAAPVVSYRTHVQTYGWEKEYVQNGDMSGTSGQSKRLEGIQIKVSGVKNLGIEYRTHVQTIGWQDYVADDAVAGTTGQSKRLEAIQIRLTGSAAADYDVYYCVHVQTYGWLNWAKNDQKAGTAGYSKRLEGIRIQILPKGSAAPASVSGAVSSFLDNSGNSAIGANSYRVVYNTHVQTYGWQDWVGDGELGGTSGQSKRLEGMHILLQNQEADGSIEYRTHVQSIGWQDWVRDGALAGTTGQSKRLEALQIRLTGEMAELYDVWYRTHCQSYGWMGWTKNGAEAGTQGFGYRMEAVEVMLLPKGNAAPGSTDTPFAKGRKIAGRTVYETTASKGKMIVLDPGHAMHIPAGSEPNAPGSGVMKAKDTYGTYGNSSHLTEYELCLQVAVKLKNELVDRGYSVVLTRETNDTAISCIERTQVANAANADAYVRIHANGGGGSGAMTICTTSANPHTQATYARSSRLSEILLDTYCKVTGMRSQGVWYTDTMTGNNWATVPTTLIEMGYMTVASEDLWMASATGQVQIVKGIADGLDKYFS